MVTLTRAVTQRTQAGLPAAGQRKTYRSGHAVNGRSGWHPLLYQLQSTYPAQLQASGLPRQRLRHWLGSLAPDNTMAGSLTMQALLDEARQRFAPGTPLNVLMMAGDRSTPASTERVDGARRVLAAHPSARLTQLVYGEWERQRALQQGLWLLQRYPQINIVGRPMTMAFGLEEAIRVAASSPANRYCSAPSTTRQAMRERRDGRLSALAAGHFMMGAWGLVLLYDYQHGHDFASEGLQLRPAVFSTVSSHKPSAFYSYSPIMTSGASVSSSSANSLTQPCSAMPSTSAPC
jgi:hypothetical protein